MAKARCVGCGGMHSVNTQICPETGAIAPCAAAAQARAKLGQKPLYLKCLSCGMAIIPPNGLLLTKEGRLDDGGICRNPECYCPEPTSVKGNWPTRYRAIIAPMLFFFVCWLEEFHPLRLLYFNGPSSEHLMPSMTATQVALMAVYLFAAYLMFVFHADLFKDSVAVQQPCGEKGHSLFFYNIMLVVSAMGVMSLSQWTDMVADERPFRFFHLLFVMAVAFGDFFLCHCIERYRIRCKLALLTFGGNSPIVRGAWLKALRFKTLVREFLANPDAPEFANLKTYVNCAIAVFAVVILYLTPLITQIPLSTPIMLVLIILSFFATQSEPPEVSIA